MEEKDFVVGFNWIMDIFDVKTTTTKTTRTTTPTPGSRLYSLTYQRNTVCIEFSMTVAVQFPTGEEVGALGNLTLYIVSVVFFLQCEIKTRGLQ